MDCAMLQHKSKKSLVDDIISRHKARTIGVGTDGVNDGRDAPKGALKYRKVDKGSEEDGSPLGWNNFVADNVFENIRNMVADDVELCKTVISYVNAIRSDNEIFLDAATDPQSLLWFELLRAVGWLDDFLSSGSVSELLGKEEPLKKDEPLEWGNFARLTEKWASDTGMDWRVWFQLLCYLRSAKLKMITNASTKTLEELDPEVASYRVRERLDSISYNYAVSKIRTLRVGAYAPLSARKVTNEQWSRIQRMVLTMYNVLPNDRNVETLNRSSPVVVDGLSLDALRDYLVSFYYNSLALHSRELSLNDSMMVNGDRVFIDHMLSKDLRNYKYISPDHRTQADADVASEDYIAMELIPPKFRMSQTFIVNAFKKDRVGLLFPGGVDQLAGLGIDSDELFNRVLEVVGTEGRVEFKYGDATDWKEWLEDHVKRLDEKEFNEKKKVIDSNPNTIVFFPSYNLASVKADDDVLGMLENVITTKNVIADAVMNSALEILEYFSFYHDKQTITREQYIGLLYKGIELKLNEFREYVLDDEGRTSHGFLKAIEEDNTLLKEILTALTTSFPIENTILPMFAAAISEEDAWIEKDVVQEVLKETKVLTVAYSDPEQYHDYEYAFAAQRDGFIERADMIELISMALRTGRITYDREFNNIAYKGTHFTAQELSVLFAAQRKDDATFIDSTFKVLYLAMSKAPEDTAFLIRNFLVVQSDADGDKMDTTDDAKSDPTKSQMVVTSDDYDLLKKLYLDLTGKTLFG